MLADGAIESVVERVPCSAFIKASQSSELIFCGPSDRLRGRKHVSNGGKFRCDLQEHWLRQNLVGKAPLIEAFAMRLSANHPIVKVVVFISLNQVLAIYGRYS